MLMVYLRALLDSSMICEVLLNFTIHNFGQMLQGCPEEVGPTEIKIESQLAANTQERKCSQKESF